MEHKIHNGNVPHYCGECPHFLYEDANGDGYCDITENTTNCSSLCIFISKIPTPHECEKILHYYQRYRRGANIKMQAPFLIGLVIDEAIKMFREQRKFY